MIFRGWHKVSYIEYPGKLATVLFVAKCNFSCPFCYNPEFVREDPNLPVIEENEVLNYLATRRGLLDAVCVTGGEPLLHPDLPLFVEKVKKQGYFIKVDTNGSAWPIFQRLHNTVDLWGLDYKLPFTDYQKVGRARWIDSCRKIFIALSATPQRVELRTTIFPPLHTFATLLAMAEEAREFSTWYWQNFLPHKTLDAKARDIAPYSLSLLEEWREKINQRMGKNLVVIRPSQ